MTEGRAREIVRARSCSMCEVCGSARAAEWHHRVNRSQMGEWCPCNGLHACNACHTWITRNPTAAQELGLSVPSGIDPATVPVLSRMYGLRVLLECDGGMRFAA